MLYAVPHSLISIKTRVQVLSNRVYKTVFLAQPTPMQVAHHARLIILKMLQTRYAQCSVLLIARPVQV